MVFANCRIALPNDAVSDTTTADSSNTADTIILFGMIVKDFLILLY
jgi:hypothetical protein